MSTKAHLSRPTNRGHKQPVRTSDETSYLKAVAKLLDEWNDTADDAAFADIQSSLGRSDRA
jgi:hypothetical protein